MSEHEHYHRVGAGVARLEAAGLVVKTGDFRRGALGQLQPIYVTTQSLGLISEEEAERRMKLMEDTLAAEERS